jgi:hypothetical protein
MLRVKIAPSPTGADMTLTHPIRSAGRRARAIRDAAAAGMATAGGKLVAAAMVAAHDRRPAPDTMPRIPWY